MEAFLEAAEAAQPLLRSLLLSDASNRKEACTWLSASLGQLAVSGEERQRLFLELVMGCWGERGGEEEGEGDGKRGGIFGRGREVIGQLLVLLCEERPADVADMLIYDASMIRRFFQGEWVDRE